MIHSSAFNQYVSGATASLHTLPLHPASHSMHHHLRDTIEKTLLRTYFDYGLGLHDTEKILYCSFIARYCSCTSTCSKTRHMGKTVSFLLYHSNLPVMTFLSFFSIIYDTFTFQAVLDIVSDVAAINCGSLTRLSFFFSLLSLTHTKNPHAACDLTEKLQNVCKTSKKKNNKIKYSSILKIFPCLKTYSFTAGCYKTLTEETPSKNAK